MAITGFLDSTKGEADFCPDGGAIDVRDSRLQIPDCPARQIDVLRIYGRGEAIARSVMDLYRLLEILDGDYL